LNQTEVTSHPKKKQDQRKRKSLQNFGGNNKEEASDRLAENYQTHKLKKQFNEKLDTLILKGLSTATFKAGTDRNASSYIHRTN
jgi:hypothetical protein